MAMLDALKNLNWHSPWVIGGVVVGGAGLAFLIYKMRQNSTATASAASTAAGTGPANESGSAQSGTPPLYIVLQDQGQSNVPNNAAVSNGTPVPVDQPLQRVPYIPDTQGGFGPPPQPTQPSGPIASTPPAPVPTSTSSPQSVPQAPQVQSPPAAPKQFVFPSAWPSPQSSLSSIAQAHGVSLSRLESFPENQYIGQRPGGWNVIRTSDRIRVA